MIHMFLIWSHFLLGFEIILGLGYAEPKRVLLMSNLKGAREQFLARATLSFIRYVKTFPRLDILKFFKIINLKYV